MFEDVKTTQVSRSQLGVGRPAFQPSDKIMQQVEASYANPDKGVQAKLATEKQADQYLRYIRRHAELKGYGLSTSKDKPASDGSVIVGWAAQPKRGAESK